MEVWISLATVLVGALATGILTYINVRSRSRAELQASEQRLLKDRRLPHYQRLFQASGMIADDPGTADGTWRSNPRKAVEPLQRWYFGDGAGMFLSEAARDRFFDLIEALQKGQSALETAGPIPADEARHICELAGRLRDQLVRDVALSRSPTSGDIAGEVSTDPRETSS